MAEFSSTLNEDKNINRSDPSRMYSIGQTPLAQLRPDKFDDMALKKQISIIQEVCRDTDPDLIALVFHECDYNMHATISRIKAGDFEDGGWQTAKSNNKKKNHNNHLGEPILNNGTQSDSERSLSQRTSPTSSLRGAGRGRRRQDHYQYSSSRTNNNRRGNDSIRNPSNSRYPSHNNPKPNPSEINSTPKETEEITPTTSSSTDEYEFIGGTSQSLTFDNSLKKSSSPASTKRPRPSSIPQEPVSMHPTIQFSTEPIDIQFGDVQWNDSIPITITPSNSPIPTKSLDEQQSPIIGEKLDFSVQDNLSSNYQTTNNIARELSETTSQRSSSSITNNPITNNSSDETSHLSDQLTNSLQQQVPIQMISSATSNTSEYLSPTSQTNNPFLPNTLSNTNQNLGSNSSAFTLYQTTPSGTFQSLPRDYSQSWNPQQSTNYKSTSKPPTMIQTGNYSPQTSYQLSPQQPYFVGTYPFTPTLVPLITSVDPWSTTGFESYPTYSTPNYVPNYPTQQQYHPNPKHDQYAYDKDFFANYGQHRLSNNEIANSSQATKDVPLGSKLSATAASFSQATNPATTLYNNPFLYTFPATYYLSQQDRTLTYPTMDNRDNRNGASYSSGNRNHYHHHQQRTHHNSTRHSQQ
jgi:hypothetical protein